MLETSTEGNYCSLELSRIYSLIKRGLQYSFTHLKLQMISRHYIKLPWVYQREPYAKFRNFLKWIFGVAKDTPIQDLFENLCEVSGNSEAQCEATRQLSHDQET